MAKLAGVAGDAYPVRNWRVGDLPDGRTMPTLWGQPIEQILSALPAFDNLFAEFKPKAIIELGTGTGGLTTYLSVWAYILGAKLITIENQHPLGSLEQIRKIESVLPVWAFVMDYNKDFFKVIEFIESPVLFLCDGAEDKGAQLYKFAPYLAMGDVLRGHDYKPEQGEKNQLKDVEADAVCKDFGYERFMMDMWNSYESDWMCLRKIR